MILALAFALIAAAVAALLGAEAPYVLGGAGVVLIVVAVGWPFTVKHWPGKRIKDKVVDIKVTPPPLADGTGATDAAPVTLQGEVIGTTGKRWGTEAIVRLVGDSATDGMPEDLTVPIAALGFPNRRERFEAGLPRHFSHELPAGWENDLGIPQAAFAELRSQQGPVGEAPSMPSASAGTPHD